MIDNDSKASSDPILDEEDKEWLNMAPIGREFGSKDYERLMAHDNLVDIASAS